MTGSYVLFLRNVQSGPRIEETTRRYANAELQFLARLPQWPAVACGAGEHLVKDSRLAVRIQWQKLPNFRVVRP
jgi:hypothetical protein